MPEKQKPFPYEDIVDLPRPAGFRRIQLSKEDRAAQFAPFAALTGHGELMEETARRTEARIELAADAQAELDRILRQLSQMEESQPTVTVTWFVPDGQKQGGAYYTASKKLISLDSCRRQLLLEDGRAIAFDDLYELHIVETAKDAR